MLTYGRDGWQRSICLQSFFQVRIEEIDERHDRVRDWRCVDLTLEPAHLPNGVLRQVFVANDPANVAGLRLSKIVVEQETARQRRVVADERLERGVHLLEKPVHVDRAVVEVDVSVHDRELDARRGLLGQGAAPSCQAIPGPRARYRIGLKFVKDWVTPKEVR